MAGRVGPRPEARAKSFIKLPRLRECKITRRTYPYASFNLDHTHLAWTHNGCLCNDLVALTHRHQVDTPPVDLPLSDVDVFLNRLRLGVSLLPMKRWKVVRGYHGQWRAKYQAAHKERDETGLLHKHRLVRFFNKADLEMSKPLKPPRAIQYRHPVFALEQARYTKAVEQWFYKVKDEYDTYIVGKSDPFTIASELHKKSGAFSQPVYLLLDASKFDSCVDVKWLRLMMEFYCKLFPARDSRRIRWLWTRTFENSGRSRSGLTYKTHGTRMSGDMDTGLGNSLIMWSMLKLYLTNNGIHKHSIMVNGDDSVIVIERSQLSASRNISIFHSLGFNMKFEVALEFNQLEFCQARPIFTDYGWTMARRPERVLGRTSWSVNNYGRSKMRAFIHTLGLCERAASWGVPIASALATKMIQATPGAARIRLSPWLEEHYNRMRRWWKLGEPTISLETRQNFADAWGISVEEQYHIERSIKISVNAVPTEVQLCEYHELIHTANPSQVGV